MQTLEETRKSRGATVTAASKHLGVSRQMYYAYERNAGKMPAAKFYAICDFYHVEPSDIFLGEASSLTEGKEVKA